MGAAASDVRWVKSGGVMQPNDTATYRGRTPNTYNIQFWVYKDRTTVWPALTGMRCWQATDRFVRTVR